MLSRFLYVGAVIACFGACYALDADAQSSDWDQSLVFVDDLGPDFYSQYTEDRQDGGILLTQGTLPSQPLDLSSPLDAGPTPGPTQPLDTGSVTQSSGRFAAFEGLPGLGFQPEGAATNVRSESVQAAAAAPAGTVLSAAAANVIAAPETGSLLRDAATSTSVSVQRRNPISFDPHVRGFRYGQILTRANGIWSPVRQDLDSMISKVDPSLIEDVTVIPGPYGLRFGPAFSFIDVQTLPTPRAEQGFESHATLGTTVHANRGRVFGRTSASGGGEDWGFRVHYGSRTGSDYRSGNGTLIPSSYNNQSFLGQLGFDLTPHSSIDIRYDRLDQTDTEYAWQFFDIAYLGTDSCSLQYVDVDPGAIFSRVALGAWYNRTRYHGDTANASKAPVVDRVRSAIAGGSAGLLDYDNLGFGGNTFGDRMLTGGNAVVTFGESDWVHARLGADFRYEDQAIQERFDITNNGAPLTPFSPITTELPKSWLLNTGIFSELVLPVLPSLDTTAGARVDFYDVNARIGDLDGPGSIDTAELAQNETLYAFYLINDLQITENWSGKLGFGHSQRTPSLIERYSNRVFLGILQSGFSRVIGDPTLAKERLWQIDAGVNADYEYFRGRANVFQSWVLDFVTYGGNRISSPEGARELFAVNSDLVTLAGFELYGEYDISDYLTTFGAMNYVQGTDQQIDAALWGVAPLDGRAGIRLHDEEGGGLWGVELGMRMVDRQNRAGVIRNINDFNSLIPIEQITAGFTTVDLRSYYNYSQNVRLTMGIENLFDKNYLEHLDLRLPGQPAPGGAQGIPDLAPVAALAPGFTFYTGVEITR